MIVSMDKKYTLGGEPFTLLTVTKPGIQPVVGHTPQGSLHAFPIHGNNEIFGELLVEVYPYADFVIDEPVMVQDAGSKTWNKRNFAGVNSKGIPFAWDDGKTRWTSREIKSTWNHCRRPTAEELAS